MTTTPLPTITGREPRLAYKKGHYRLSLRGLGTMLNMLPPESISLDAAEAALRNKDFYVRYNAARLLRRRGDRDARIIMEDALMNGDAPTRASVARELYGFSWFSAEPLLRRALKDDDERVHECAVYALCDLRELRGYQLLVEVLPRENDHVKAAAAWGLHNCQDPEAVPVLQVALTATDPDVRVKVLEALGANDTPEALPVVHGALDDPEPEVQYAATLSLVELQSEACFLEIARLIEHTSGSKRQQILRGFFHATNYLLLDVATASTADLVLDALEQALLDPLPEARLAAIWPLAWIRMPRAPIILRRAYDVERDSEVKARIVKIAYNLMSEVRDEILLDASHSSDETVKEAAEQIRIMREQV
ncbi:MAG TPA: HEAT repeat domain-containing protein [Anaerolineae bacterium]|nr:HEAT repeat domain-containing protein [Anaerolineae bacterium]